MKRPVSLAFFLLACLGLGVAQAAADTVTGAVAVSAGAYHTCALTSAGGVLCWGDNEAGALGNGTTASSATPLPVVGLSSGVVAISAGGWHTCALTSAGAVLCWGNNADGELGDGTTVDRLTPVPVAGLSSGVIAISAGFYHTCAITSAGALQCWGSNSSGQVGDGTTVTKLSPVPVFGLTSGVISVGAGGYHTCALITGGTVTCWGDDTWGQAGNNGWDIVPLPATVAGLGSSAVAVSASYLHTCAWTSAGVVKCWGGNQYSQLGDGTTTTSGTAVTVASLPAGVTQVAAGGAHTCLVTSASRAWCWGDDEYGQTGNNGTVPMEARPIPVAGASGSASAISAGYVHSCTITPGGGVRCWGDNTYGQLGDGTLTARKAPVTVIGFAGVGPLAATIDPSGVDAVSATLHGSANPDGETTTAWFEYGATTSYGSTTPSQDMGAGTSDVATAAMMSGLSCGSQYHYRVAVSNASGTAYGADVLFWTAVCVMPTGRSAVSAGTDHTCFLTAAGAVWCWGANGYGQLGNGTTQASSVPVPVTGLSSGVTAIAAGTGHTCALTSGGGVLCWGVNQWGQLGDGTNTQRFTPVPVSGLSSGVVALAAGSWHTCALTQAGSAYCWGANSGQLGDGTTENRNRPVAVSSLTGVVAITAGWSHTCALRSNGAMFCWGGNISGALGDGSMSARITPVGVSGLSAGVMAINAGGNDGCALKTGNALVCWGDNYTGKVGDGTTTVRLTAIGVGDLSGGVSAVAGGGSHTCALLSTGRVLCWGGDSVGDGTTAARLAPVDVVGLPGGVRAITAGGGQMCALTVADTVWCWGKNGSGELGDATTTSRLTPVGVVGFGSTLPLPVTGAASSVTSWTASLGGTVNPEGLPTTAWFEYYVPDIPTNPVRSTPAQSVGAGTAPVAFDVTATGLVCGANYRFRLAATNASGTLYGGYWPFSTSACPAPTLTGITPAAGSTKGYYSVVLTGTNLVPGMTVRFGDTSVSVYLVTVVSSTELRVITPEHAAGPVDVTVVNRDGQQATLPQSYLYRVIAPADFGAGGKSDYAVFRGSTGQWFVYGQASAIAFGQDGDIPVVADYNGDGKADIAVYRPSTCESIVKDHAPVVFGQTGDVPVPGDYNGDLRAEMAVFRPSTGEWIIEGQDTPTVYGMRGDIPVPADYNGNGVTELAVFRPTTGVWYVKGGDTLTWGMWGDVPVPADYNGDGLADVAVYRPSTGWWYSGGYLMQAAQWGAPGDIPVPLDTNGDGVTEFVVFRPSNGTWYSLQPWTVTKTSVAWGQAGDTPIGQPPQLPARPTLKTAGDFDNDGAADVTVFRPSTGGWYTLQSTRAYHTSVSVTLGQAGDVPVSGDYQGAGLQERAVYRPSTGQWLLEDGRSFTLGASDDVPVPGDYDGDGVSDIAVFTPGTGLWSILTGASGFTTLVTELWGASGDVAAPGDYDGDGQTDFAVFTPATGQWSIRSSLTGTTLVTVPFGMSGDIPVPGDYDGDGKMDIAVYRPSTGYWYVLTSSSTWSNWQYYWWGAVGDVPVPGDYDGDGATDVAVYRPSTGTWYVMDVMTISGWGQASDIPVLSRK